MEPAISLRQTRNTPARNPSLSEQLAARAPHFSSFDHVKDPRARRAKEVEQFLIFVAEMCPEVAESLRPTINEQHARGEAGRVSTRDLILEAMTRPLAPATMEEFVDDLELPYGTLYENLMKLADVGLVAITTRPREHEPQGKRGGSRKPELIFTITELYLAKIRSNGTA